MDIFHENGVNIMICTKSRHHQYMMYIDRVIYKVQVILIELREFIEPKKCMHDIVCIVEIFVLLENDKHAH